MKSVLIIGGGLAGITTAFALTRHGLSVTVLESRDGIALESSFANGAMLTAGMADPWNAPGVHRHLLASLLQPTAALKLRARAIPSLAGWALKFLRHSAPGLHARATIASYHLAAHSLATMRALRGELSLDYSAAQVGTMKLFANDEDMERPLQIAQALASSGLRYSRLDSAAAVAMEPQLAPAAHRIRGALHFPDDESGDAHEFCKALTRVIRSRDGTVRTGIVVRRLVQSHGRIAGVETSAGQVSARHVVLAAGTWSDTLARTVGLKLPIRPAKGYSLTLETAGMSQMPRIPIIDDAMHAAIVPLGTRLRIAGTAEFAGLDRRIPRERIDSLFELLQSVYPHVASRIDRTRATVWAGFRPMSADGLPFIGATAIEGLWLNTGHGHLGWTMAMGSSSLLAAQMLGTAPGIDPLPYRAQRA